MGSNIEKDYEFVKNKFQDFKGYMRIDDFKTFLLMIISEDTNQDMVNKFLEGSNPNKLIWHDVIKNAYIFDIGMAEDKLVIYTKDLSNLDKQIIKADAKSFFDKYLSRFEQEKLIDAKMSLNIIKYLDKTHDVMIKHKKSAKYEVTKIFADFLSFIFGIGKVKSLLVLDGNDKEPDIIFTLSMSISNVIDENIIQIYALVDHNKVCRKQFLKINKTTMEFESVSEIKESSFSDLYNNQYLLLIHVKSFDVL